MDSIRRRPFLAMLPLGAAGAIARAAAPNQKLNIIVAGGHPGDPEYGCGGVIARYTELGHDVTLLYLNKGQKGCPEPDPSRGSDIRVSEARKACSILKAKPLFAAQCDGHSVVDAAHYDQFRSLLEAQKPDVVFTQWPIDHHRDHRAVSVLVYDAWVQMRKNFVLYYYEVSNGEDTMMFHPSEYVDISSVEPRKRAACYAHASQSPDRYYALQDEVARFRGIESGVTRAEAFARLPGTAGGLLP